MTDELLEFTERMQSERRLTSLGEAATKQVVVMRILGLLGWNPFNVEEVHPEYSVTGGIVDFSLRHQKDNKVFIEVKKVNEDLERHQEQLLDYCFKEGVQLAILTNGIAWWFYLPLNAGSWSQRKFYTIEIYDQDAEEITEKLVDFLSKGNVTSGKAVENAKKVYSSMKKQNLTKDTLPKAWSKLINEPDEGLIELIAETTEKLCGHRPDNSMVENFIDSQKLRAEDMDTQTSRPGESKKKISTLEGSLVTDGTYTGKRITSFTLKGAKYAARSWKDMLIQVCGLMSTGHRDRFDQVLTLSGRKRPYFSKNSNELRSPVRVEETDIFVETNLNARLIVRIIEDTISLFGYISEDLLIEAR